MGLSGLSGNSGLSGVIQAAAPPPTVDTFTATPGTINEGSSATLEWTTTNATSATLNGSPVNVNDSQSVSPTETTEYTLAATGPGGSAQDSVTVTVRQTVTFAIGASGDDNFVYRGPDASYPPTTLGTSAGTNNYVQASRNLNVGNYLTANGLLRWDTSALPDGAVVTAVQLRFWLNSVSTADARSLTADWDDFGGGASDSGDYSATALTTALTAKALSELTAGAYNVIDLDNGAGVSVGGYTGLRLHVSGGQPTGNNTLSLASKDDGTKDPPQLIVTYHL